MQKYSSSAFILLAKLASFDSAKQRNCNLLSSMINKAMYNIYKNCINP